MNMIPNVSILVPVYNVSRFIERCAVSLFTQTCENIEFVFFDDCSPDNSIEILQGVVEKYPHRAGAVKILRGESNQGLAVARNALIEAASGRYILHVDSDDYIESDCVEVLLKKAISAQADIVVSDIFREQTSNVIVQRVRFSEDKTEYLNLVLAGLSPSYNCGKLINSSLYREHGILCKPGVNVLEDYHTFTRLAYFATKIVKINEPLYHYIQYNENAYTKSCNEKFMQNVCEAIAEVDCFYMSLSDKEVYMASIQAFKVMTKINNIKKADLALQKKIVSLFPDIQMNMAAKWLRLSLIDRILYLLINTNQILFISLFVKLTNRVIVSKKRLVG